MRESDLLSHILRRSAGLRGAFPHVLVGPGDDAAVLGAPSGRQILLTVDHLIEGRHYAAPSGTATPLGAIARKAVARSVSDIAAMGGSLEEWGAAVATAALPHGFPRRDADEIFDRMKHWAEHWNCPLVGGDISAFGEGALAGPPTLTVTVLGLAHAGRGPVLRSGAQAGDAVYITGALGGSFRSGRHLTFEPRLREARWLCDALGARLHAMIDISDGLGRDTARIAAASGLVIELSENDLPLHPGSDGSGALGDGEDYELAFTLAEGAEVPGTCPATGTPLTRIGAVRAPKAGEHPASLVRRLDGSLFDASASGWDHA